MDLLSAPRCALCHSVPASKALIKRQKRLNKQGHVEKDILIRLLWQRQLPFNHFSFSDPASVICVTCQRQLKKVQTLEKDLMTAIININTMVDLQYRG